MHRSIRFPFLCRALCGRNPEFFTDFVTPHLLIEVFKASSHSNRVDLVVFSGEVLDLLHDFGHSHEITQESFRNLTNIAKVNLYSKLTRSTRGAVRF